jgi:IrrE N-terminal-like domain
MPPSGGIFISMPLQIHESLAKHAIDEVTRLRDAYTLHCLDSKASQRSVAGFLTICRMDVDKEILIHEHPDTYRNHLVSSIYLKLPDKYVIVLLAEMNNCWKRFAICKELFHVILNTPENFSIDIKGHVEDFFAGITSTTNNSNQDSSQMEMVAEFAAMEFFFPYVERSKIKAAFPNPDFAAIAERYKIPRIMVERYLTNNFMEFLAQFNNPDAE